MKARHRSCLCQPICGGDHALATFTCESDDEIFPLQLDLPLNVESCLWGDAFRNAVAMSLLCLNGYPWRTNIPSKALKIPLSNVPSKRGDCQ